MAHSGMLREITNVTSNVAPVRSRQESCQTRGAPPSAAWSRSTGSTRTSTPSVLEDLLAEDVASSDPQQVAEYATDIFSNMGREEAKCIPRADFLKGQPEINAKFRAVLIDWLVEVQRKYKLKTETLFLAVALIDRYLSLRPVRKGKLQLVGVACILIAAKFEELYPPEIREMVYITDNAYTKRDIINMEVSIVQALEFKIAVPTAAHFFEHFHRACRCTDKHRDLLQYVLELSLLDVRFVHVAPSHLVAAALLLSNKLMRQPSTAWPPHMVTCTNYVEAAIKPVAKELCGLLESAHHSSLEAVRRKFSHERYNCVAKMEHL